MTPKVRFKSLSWFLILALILFTLSSILFLELIVRFPSSLVFILLLASTALLIPAIFAMIRSFLNYSRWISGETHPILHKRIHKDIKITTVGGNATVEYSMHCRRNTDAPLKQLVNRIKHDGRATLREVKLNNRPISPKVEEFVLRKVVGKTEELADMPHQLRLTIFFDEDSIMPGWDFNYSYIMDYVGVYSEMKKRKGDFTSHHMLFPTLWFSIKVQLPPDSNIRFLPDSVTVRVLDKNEVENFAEEHRVNEKYAPKVKNHRKTLFLEIYKPKLASTYKLHFRVQ